MRQRLETPELRNDDDGRWLELRRRLREDVDERRCDVAHVSKRSQDFVPAADLSEGEIMNPAAAVEQHAPDGVQVAVPPIVRRLDEHQALQPDLGRGERVGPDEVPRAFVGTAKRLLGRYLDARA